MLALMVAPALVPAFAKDADLNLNGSFTAADNDDQVKKSESE